MKEQLPSGSVECKAERPSRLSGAPGDVLAPDL
jgi:hypothetical protein